MANRRPDTTEFVAHLLQRCNECCELPAGGVVEKLGELSTVR
jgi:hypothetical protein